MPDNIQLLSAARVNTVMSSLQDQRGIPQRLRFLSRTPVVPATEGEIMARFMGQILIADLIADGQRAGIYSGGKMYLESFGVPNLKLGQALNQEQLNQLNALASGIDIQDNLFPTTEARILDNLRTGVQFRMEFLLVAAMLGSLSSYDRLGIKLSNVNFGMPSDLQITPTNEWTDTGSATPVADILVAKRLGQIKYGIVYDRLTIGLAGFNAMIATTEFQNKSRTYLAPNVSFTNLNAADTEFQKNLATNVLGLKEIELYDDRYWQEQTDGSLRSFPFWPINKAMLSSTSMDNDASVLDFANGVVTEAIVSNVGGSKIQGQLPANARGPVAYTTAEDNPPSISYWGVGRGFPRRHYQQATAVLTIAPETGAGSIDETIDFEEIAFS